jgi:arylsulfatase A-like enzyme
MRSFPRPLPLLVLVVAGGWLASCARRPEGPNILLITLDTTRRDHLGMYGYPIPTSPNLDRLAADSVVYTNAYAVSSWTMPTHASSFTGKFPSAHGANYDPEGPLNLGDGIGAQFGGYRARPIAEDEVTLAELLSDHGYETGGIIAGPWMLEAFRLGKGFEHYDDQGVSALNGRPAEDVTRAAIEYVDEHAEDPFFLFLNYYDPHSPWWSDPPVDAEGKPAGPPPPFQDVRPVMPPGLDPTKIDPTTYTKICYDAEIRYMDREIGKLIDHLKVRGLYENTWIWVLSDHGELLGDPVLADDTLAHPGLWGHGDSLSEAEIHIPFFVKAPGPGGRTGEDATPVQQVDVLPTILAHLGLDMPPNVQGRPLGGKHPIVAELYKLPMMNRTDGERPKDWRHLGDWRVLVEGRHKFAWSSNETHYLIDLEADPGERTNLVDAQAELAETLELALDAYITRMPKPGATGAIEQPSPEALEALKGLGYGGE